jgi:hypothetical protein
MLTLLGEVAAGNQPIFAQSAFVPVAVGFFGLGVGYFIWGGQALFGFPEDSPEVNRSMGMWGFWMPGFMQFLTGVYLMVGLTWFAVFREPVLYMAALAFTAYGVHWFAMAHRRYVGASSKPDAWMAIPFFLISVLGAVAFAKAGGYPVAILFVGLSLIYLTEIPTRFGVFDGHRLVGLWQFLTGVWLMYLTWATVMNVALGEHWWA